MYLAAHKILRTNLVMSVSCLLYNNLLSNLCIEDYSFHTPCSAKIYMGFHIDYE